MGSSSRTTHQGNTGWLPTDPKERAKLIVALVVSVLCIGWLTYYIVSSIHFTGSAEKLDTPAWRIADEMNKKLLEHPEFSDVGFVVETESPMHFNVVGAVHKQADLPALEAFLKQIRPENDYTFNVQVLQGG